MGKVTLSVRPAGDAIVLDLEGRVTIADLPRLREELESSLSQTGGHTFLLNCGAIHTVDSTLLGFFVSLFKTVQRAGRGFALVNVSPDTRDALRMTGLTRILTVHDTLDQALEALKG